MSVQIRNCGFVEEAWRQIFVGFSKCINMESDEVKALTF